jgi:hypothetical protein
MGTAVRAVERVAAVDWSGDRSAAGQRKKIWAGVWTEDAAGHVDGGRVTLEGGRTREELGEWLVAMAQETPGMVVGVDFCFSYPAWFLEEHGARDAAEFWRTVVARGEHWLSHECEDARFWGRRGRYRSGKKPLEFSGDQSHRMFRLADLACKVKGEILDPANAQAVKGIAPKSPFQIGGAGAVGTGTLRGIPMLHWLREKGFRIWPFDASGLREGKPLLVEIYPRLLTGEVRKGNRDERRKYLARKQKMSAAYASLAREAVAKAQQSEDAFDALISVMEMTARRDGFLSMKRATAAMTLLEGAVWGAGV